MNNKMADGVNLSFLDFSSDRLYHEMEMYAYLEDYTKKKGFTQSEQILVYVLEAHQGQTRNGKDQVPYVYHPFLIACQAIALGLADDNFLSVALLHDVCEDCAVDPKYLPVNEETREAVVLLTKDPKNPKDDSRYYANIAKNPMAAMVKLLDRCNNISTMCTAFSKPKMISYIEETNKYIYPLMEQMKCEFPMYMNKIFLIQYHMSSVIHTIMYLTEKV